MQEPSLIKLHLFVAHSGIASRRKASQLVQEGKVKVNGKIVTNVAQLVNSHADTIEVDGRRLQLTSAEPVHIALYKPREYVTTVSEPEGRKTVLQLIPRSALPQGVRIYPVGRLDMDSEGLVLLTNDGELTYALTHPKYEIPKTYHVLVQGSPSGTMLKRLMTGIYLKEGKTAPAKVTIVRHEEGNTWISMTIHEGRNRQIRRMCSAIGLQVLRLVRVSLGTLKLGVLKPGAWRHLTADEVQSLQHETGK